jgi:hypothetical protein
MHKGGGHHGHGHGHGGRGRRGWGGGWGWGWPGYYGGYAYDYPVYACTDEWRCAGLPAGDYAKCMAYWCPDWTY